MWTYKNDYYAVLIIVFPTLSKHDTNKYKKNNYKIKGMALKKSYQTRVVVMENQYKETSNTTSSFK